MDHLDSYWMIKPDPAKYPTQYYAFGTPMYPLRGPNRAPPDKAFLYAPDDDY